MERIVNKRINEECYRIKHKSGCTIMLYPMKGFSTAYALFGTRYGSVDTTFKTAKDEDYVTVPEGIAHYLEHKLFENEDCDAFALYAATGASANAFTSFDKTAYLFSCADKLEENLEILLGFVQKPYFTDETVAKEQGIIGQEIRMYEDAPDWRVFFNCLQGMYEKNPVRIDIAGTVESISHIDKDLLYRCYNTFYNLNNMVLAVAGNLDVDKVLAVCDKMLIASEDPQLSVKVPEESDRVCKRRMIQELPCATPLFNIGFKLPAKEGSECYRDYILYNLMGEICLGKTSDFYNRMYESNLINNNFYVRAFNGRGFFGLMAEGESADPDKVYEEILKELAKLKKEGISRDDFDTIRNKTYGEIVGMFGGVESVASNLLEFELAGAQPYDLVDFIAEITFEDVVNALKNFDEENSTISIIKNKI